MPAEPKPPSRRRRRNHVAGEGALPAEGRQGPAPELPSGLIWVEWTRQYWALIWASPMATRWTEYDVPSLLRLAQLQQTALIDGDRRLLAEIRQLEDRFGLSPRGRRLLGWEIADAPLAEPDDASAQGPDDSSADAPLAEPDDASIDPRRLRLVRGG
jgi:hypothetical protein